MLVDKLMTCFASPVSTYTQTMANNDVSGSEASAAAQNELRLAISDIATKTVADIKIFKPYCHIAITQPEAHPLA